MERLSEELARRIDVTANGQFDLTRLKHFDRHAEITRFAQHATLF